MAAESGQDLDGLIADLQQHAPEYHVFQAIYLAEIASKHWHAQRKEHQLDQAGLRFRPHEMYVYPPRDIRAFECRNGEMAFVLNFMGLYGVNSPLPRCYHEQVAIQQNEHGAGEVPLQNFLDIFNNRFYWLYYQAWKKYRYYLQLRDEAENKTAQRVFSFLGRGPEAAHQRATIPRLQLLQFSGLLCNRQRSKAGLLIVLHEFFPRFPAHIREFVPHWVKLDRVPLMGSKEPEQAPRLGVNAIAGNSMLSYTSRICVEIGPMPFVDYLDFTPRGRQANLLVELLELYLSDGLEFNVRFLIQSDTIVTVPWNDRRLKLGTSIWLGKPKEELMPVQYSYEQYVGKN